MLKLDDEDEVPAKTSYVNETKLFEIDEIDTREIRVSNEYSYIKEHESYKPYVFNEHNNEYIPLKIILKDVDGHDSKFKILMLEK